MKPNQCDICDEPIGEDQELCGCDGCGRLFGPCCNSVVEDLCLACIESKGEDFHGDFYEDATT